MQSNDPLEELLRGEVAVGGTWLQSAAAEGGPICLPGSGRGKWVISTALWVLLSEFLEDLFIKEEELGEGGRTTLHGARPSHGSAQAHPIRITNSSSLRHIPFVISLSFPFGAQ